MTDLKPEEIGVLIIALEVFIGEMYETGDPETNRIWKRQEKIAERMLKQLLESKNHD